MKKVTSADSLVTISHYRNLLQSEGIEAFIRNEHLGSIVGDIPYPDVWPELWIRNDLDFDRATQLIHGDILDESPSEPWTCSQCGAENGGQFAACWQCMAHFSD